MPTPTKGPRLGGSPAHERLILANLAQSLFEHGKITTTEAKAKRLRPLAEKLITSAKRGTLHSRREVMKVIRDKNVVHILFAEIAPAVANRPGGYTRIVKMMPRKGDNAPMAIIEIITEETVSSAASRMARRAAATAPKSDNAAARSRPRLRPRLRTTPPLSSPSSTRQLMKQSLHPMTLLSSAPLTLPMALPTRLRLLTRPRTTPRMALTVRPLRNRRTSPASSSRPAHRSRSTS